MVGLGSGESPRSQTVPFDRIVGQTALKEALLAVATDAALDGLLIRGEKGTGKSTAVRGLVELLPQQSVIAECPYGCPPDTPARQCADCRDRSDPAIETRSVPLVTLPLGATRERVVGSLSVADALSGEPEFEPGLLARANRGLLYVDEVNLLDDHLVDVLLDAAASGQNHVERDGVSVTHPASVTLVGTMNPEEGSLRPQLRDRFALQATVEGCADPEDRVAIVEQALGEESEAERSTENRAVPASRSRLREARDRLPAVDLPGSLTRKIAELCLEAGVEGHRGDIAIARAARAIAALDGRTTVHEPDVEAAARFALPHRLQSRPFDDAPDAETVLEECFDDERPEDGEPGDPESAEESEGDSGEGDRTASDEEGGDTTEQSADDRPDGKATDERTGESPEERGGGGSDKQTDQTAGEHRESGDDECSDRSPDQHGNEGNGNRSRPQASPTASASDSTADETGDTEGSSATDAGNADEAATPLIPGATRQGIGDGSAPEFDAPTAVETTGDAGDGHDTARTERSGTGARVRTEQTDGSGSIDAAATVRATAARGGSHVADRDLRQSVRKATATALIVVAIDASASMRGPMRAAKGTVLELLEDAYQQRDAVAVVAFAGTDADVLLPPTDSVELAARHLKELPTGDRTPLPAGIETTADVLERADPDIGVAVVVTDGRATAGTEQPTADTRKSAQRLGAVADRTIVVDAGDEGRGLTALLAATADGRVVSIDELTPQRMDRAVGNLREN